MQYIMTNGLAQIQYMIIINKENKYHHKYETHVQNSDMLLMQSMCGNVESYLWEDISVKHISIFMRLPFLQKKSPKHLYHSSSSPFLLQSDSICSCRYIISKKTSLVVMAGHCTISLRLRLIETLAMVHLKNMFHKLQLRHCPLEEPMGYIMNLFYIFIIKYIEDKYVKATYDVAYRLLQGDSV